MMVRDSIVSLLIVCRRNRVALRDRAGSSKLCDDDVEDGFDAYRMKWGSQETYIKEDMAS